LQTKDGSQLAADAGSRFMAAGLIANLSTSTTTAVLSNHAQTMLGYWRTPPVIEANYTWPISGRQADQKKRQFTVHHNIG
jgi:hypothetical protein